MGSLSVSLKDKDIIEFLRQGGKLETPVGAQLIEKLIDSSLDDNDVQNVLGKYDIDKISLVMLYAYIVRSLLPDPTINVSGPLLVSSLFFMEPHRLDQLLQLGWTDTADLSIEHRRASLFTMANEIAKLIYTAHASQYGKTGFIANESEDQSRVEQQMDALAKGRMFLRVIGVAIICLIIYFVTR